MFANFNFEIINLNIIILKLLFVEIFTYYTYRKITNNTEKFMKKQILYLVEMGLVSMIVVIIRYKFDYFISIVSLVFFLSLINSHSTNSNLGYSILCTIVSLSINYILLFIEIIITFVINIICPIRNDYLNFIIMMVIHSVILYNIGKISRIKNGIVYFNNKNIKSNDYIDIIILHLSVLISLSFIIFADMDVKSNDSRRLFISFIILGIIMFLTIQKSIQLYYKQKLLIQDLTETKSDLEKSKQEIQKLEKENIELSKKNHSFNHKYKALEHKLKEQLLKTEMAEEISIKDQLDDLSKEIYVVPQNTDPSKTNIEKIDDMLKFMQSECDEHKITFNLQVIGNIYHMTNNFISQEELQILIADHIKDAIIAINHSDNINKSILVKLGKIEDCYGLYIYDSGIEFEKETLENLGKKPITTHVNEGGSGMGFMNTFDTLRRHNASLIIEELGKPCKENFTKIIKFRFDGKNEFKVISYRNK